MRRRLACALLLVVALSASADKPAPIELGFKPEKLYSFGSLENVNLFNGNVVLTIPLGLRYPVSSNLSFGLTLVYNSKAWDHYYVESATNPADIRAWSKPNVRSNAGMGWRLSLGRLIPPSDYTSTSGYADIESSHWYYESPTGDEHALAFRTNSDPVTISNDGTFLRMVIVSSTSRQVQFPNGEIHTFTYERDAWRLTRIVDAFGNWITVAYAYDGTSSRTTQWTITDRFNRVHTIAFINSASMAESVDRGQIVKSITMRGYGSNPTYTFDYNLTAQVDYSCKHNIPLRNSAFPDGPTTTKATVPLLTRITLPDQSTWAFDYHMTTSTDCASGLLKDVTLPTLGKMSYAYQLYTIPANDSCTSDGPSNSSPGVRTRTVNGQTWTYLQTVSPVARTFNEAGDKYTCSAPSPDGEQSPGYPQPAYRWKRTAVIAPAHSGTARARTDHYFSILRDNAVDGDAFGLAAGAPYGYPTTAAWPGVTAAKLAPATHETAPDVSAADVPADPAPRYLLEQSWSGCTATGDCSAAQLLQSRYSRSSLQPDGFRHPLSERTIFEDDSGCAGGTAKCYKQTDYSEYDGVGHMRQAVESGNFRGDAQATSRTEYISLTSTQRLSTATKWVLDRYTERSRTIGGRTSRSEYCFAATGELLRTRLRTTAGAQSASDVIEAYTYTSGNMTGAATYGGDLQAVPVGSLCGLTLATLTAAYQTSYSWAAGALAAEWAVDPATGSGMLFDTRNYTRHTNTGLITRSTATDGLATSFGYTAWGALSAVTPPGELATSYTYTNATATTSAKVTATRGDSTAVYEYDAMGRLSREEKALPGAGCVQRRITYDAWSRVANETVWHACTAASPGSTRYAYDALGRTTSVTTPDNKVVTTAYTGSRIARRTASVAATSGETNVTTSEEYDRFGRLIEVIENAGATGSQTSSYTYDDGDRLKGVTMGAQTRAFTYDGRGFLTSEQHPELNNGTTRYREYDARGHARRRTTGADNSVFDIRFAFDPAERLTLVTRVSDGRKLKELVYDDPDAIYCGMQICYGKLVAAARYHWDADLSNVATGESLAVTETYKYDYATGKPSRRDRAIGNTSLFTGNSFYFAQTYNDIGAIASIYYPCSDIAGCPLGTERVVSHGYTKGVLTSVGDWASAITYAPNGTIDTVWHGLNGAAGLEVWTRDATGIARPKSIAARTASGSTLWTTGDYAYDGSGNIKSMGTKGYSYDPLQRLVRWSQIAADGSSTFSGREYDRYGNPLYNTSGSCAAGGTPCTTTNGASRAISGTTNRYADTTYDVAGNVTSDPSNRSFTYDSLGMMSRAQNGTRQFRYLYTVDDERIAIAERLATTPATFRTTYTIRGFDNQLLSVWRSSPSTNAVSWIEDEIRRGSSLLARESAAKNTTHYFLDHLGSPRAITNASGGLLGTQQFDPFGFGGTTDGGALQFTAHERDAALYGTGTTTFPDYMHARYYDVGGGRFLAFDPTWESADLGRPQTWNRYSYVLNNPLNGTDPDGRACVAIYFNTSSGFCTRAAEYRRIDANPKIQSQTRFFAAANAVSQALANVATPVGGLFVSGQVANFLEGVGQKLEKFNRREAAAIQSGALRGPNLDQQLVHKEQSLVQGQLNALKKADPRAYSNTITQINRVLNGDFAGFAVKLAASDRAYAGVLDGVRKSLGRDIDFARQSDREAIGNALVKHIRQTGGCDVTGGC